MTKAQQKTLRSLVLELGAKHGDKRIKRSLAHINLPGPLLAAAIAAVYADHWPYQRALKYFTSLGITESELNHALHLLGRHLNDVADWYKDWQPSFN